MPLFAQVALAGTQIFWTTEVNNAFGRLEEGYENALKDYYKKQISQLNALIVLLLGNLSKGDRQKVGTEDDISHITSSEVCYVVLICDSLSNYNFLLGHKT